MHLVLNSAAITGDDQGNLFIIYSGNRDGNGVYFLTSDNAGENWSEPSPIFLTYDTTSGTFQSSSDNGAGQSSACNMECCNISWVWMRKLFFANYNIPNSEWNTPVELR